MKKKWNITKKNKLTSGITSTILMSNEISTVNHGHGGIKIRSVLIQYGSVIGDECKNAVIFNIRALNC